MVAVAKEKKNKTNFGQRLREIRESRGLTQSALARLLGMADTAVSRLEAGGRDPSWATVISISRSLGLSPNDFLGDDDQPVPIEEPEPPPAPPPRRTGKK
jgi:transcriptional regulator with XRE-family HTH domain